MKNKLKIAQELHIMFICKIVQKKNLCKISAKKCLFFLEIGAKCVYIIFS